jgi:tetratricopeptide (TPR) repeat protein
MTLRANRCRAVLANPVALLRGRITAPETFIRLLHALRPLADRLWSFFKERPRAAVAKALDERLPIEVVGELQFTPYLLSKVSYMSSTRVKKDLLNQRGDPSHRMAAIMALRSMPSREISPLLRAILTDPVDDIRLLAYGMLDAMEKALMQRILLERAKLDTSLSDEDRCRVTKALAEAYKELVYARVVQGDVYRDAVEQAELYARSALQWCPRHPDLWQLRGRLALEARQLDQADAMFKRAVECGFPRGRLLPYFAEIAYQRRDYEEVRRLLREMKAIPPPLLAAVAAYWTSQDVREQHESHSQI